VTGWYDFFVAPISFILNRWEVIIMMDSVITFGDLLKLGSFLLEAATFAAYIYYNHKNNNHRNKKK